MMKQFIFVAFLALLLKRDIAEAFCCRTTCSRISSGGANIGICGDCSEGTPYCGKGSCNVFGCACRGDGCHEGACSNSCPRGKRHVAEGEQESQTNLDEIFAQYDKDKNGYLQFSEVKEWCFKSHGWSEKDTPKVKEEFDRMDSNKDGKISRDEMDD